MQKPPIQVRSQENFERLLSLELMESERKKCIWLAIMSGFTVCGAAVVMTFAPDYFVQSLGDRQGARFWFLTVPGAVMVYELACAGVLRRRISRGDRAGRGLTILSAVLEPTAVTLWLAYECLFFKPGSMFTSPISFFYPGIVLLSCLQLSWKICIFCGFVAAAEFMGLGAWQWSVLPENTIAFLPTHVVRALTIFSAGLTAAFVAREIRRGIEQALRTLKERDFVVSIFGRYLTDEVVDDILRSPEGLLFGGKRRTVTLMMTDLRGFSTLSESLPPESVLAILNNFLATMTDVIVRHRGTIDEFLGDSILAIFGAPLWADDDPLRAVTCAIEMELAMDSVNQWNRQNGFPHLEMGIGINTGPVVVGNIGSEKRSKYGVVGSAVNLTSRIESYTVGGQIFASAATVEALGLRLRIGERRTVHPKGIAQPIEICEVRGIDGPTPLELPPGPSRLSPLESALSVHFVIFEGKDAAGPAQNGKLIEISERCARLQTSIPLQVLSNLRLELHGCDGEPIPGSLLAKVIDGAELVYLIRFTAMDRAVQDFVNGLLLAPVSG